MKLKIIVFPLLLAALFCCGCDRNEPRVFQQTLNFKFLNDSNENLIEKYNVEIDSSVTNIVSYFIKECEYSLKLKINGEEFTPNFPLFYDGPDMRGYKFIQFGCWDNNSNLKNKRSPYTYEFYFVCPKLFGDSEPHKLEVVWYTKTKTMYNRVRDIKFDGKAILHEDDKSHNVVIVLD